MKFPATDWATIPTKTLNVKSLSKPYDIVDWFKTHNIKKYIYRINYKGLVLKYGMSCDKNKIYGERVYRQVGHAVGWDSSLSGPSGDDWYDIEQRVIDQYNIVLHRNNLSVEIWNVTNYDFSSIHVTDEIKRMESELIQNYTNCVGQKPIGNIAQDEKIFNKGIILADVYNNIFETI